MILAITVGTDTYITLADADTYISNNYVTTSTEYITWDALTDANKEIYLKNATKKIDRGIYRGIKAVSTQTLEFPRALKTFYRREDYPNLWRLGNRNRSSTKSYRCTSRRSCSLINRWRYNKQEVRVAKARSKNFPTRRFKRRVWFWSCNNCKYN